jgi:hypothetical protein
MATTATPRRARQAKPSAATKLGSFPAPTDWSEQMAVDNRLLAMDCANRFASSCGIAVSELEMAAWVGLLKACRLYDPKRINPETGEPFALSTIAVPYIRGAMKQHVRDKTFQVKFPHKWRELGPKVRRLAHSGMASEAIAAEIVADGKSITAFEVDEILGCMKSAVELDIEPVRDYLHESVAIAEQDDAGWEYFDHCLALAAQAGGKLNAADLEQIGEWTGADGRRQSYPGGPLQQFMGRLRTELRDRKGSAALAEQLEGTEAEQLRLDMVIVAGTGVMRPARRQGRLSPSAGELMAGVEQLGLFGMQFEPDFEGGEG